MTGGNWKSPKFNEGKTLELNGGSSSLLCLSTSHVGTNPGPGSIDEKPLTKYGFRYLLLLNVGNEGMIQSIIMNDNPSNPLQPIHSLRFLRTRKDMVTWWCGHLQTSVLPLLSPPAWLGSPDHPVSKDHDDKCRTSRSWWGYEVLGSIH